MKARELRELSTEELGSKLSDLGKELLDLRFKRASNQLANPLKLREVRRNMAQILTILQEKAMEVK